MKKLITVLVITVLFLLATSSQVWGRGWSKPYWCWWKLKPAFKVSVVSSSPDQVSGGDARLHIGVPKRVAFSDVKVMVNRTNQTDHFTCIPGTRTLTGVVDGLRVGINKVTIKVKPRKNRWRWWRGWFWKWHKPRPVKLTLINHAVTGPIFSGPHQHPFICSVQEKGLGQPLVDHDKEGFPVFDELEIIGYSKNCSAETLVEYVYKSTDGYFKPYSLGGDRPDDMSQTTTMDGQTVDYIVRWERGTINRFIYSIAMLAPGDTSPDDLSTKAWNGKLIYYFQGGVAIGHYQGSPSGSRMLYDHGLSLGYAIAYSTGTKSGTHYNLVLGGETALMVKERFIELYGVPTYTVGLGGSGGAIQQYIYAQNHPGLIDAAIPQYSYPDMVTQAIHIGDCELLEFYMDNLDGTNPKWGDWQNRTLLEGLNASETVFNPYTQAFGASECVMGWRGLSPLAMNPLYGMAENQDLYEPQSAVEAIEWSHFGDLINIYGVADDSYARNFWDNVGVQYGLKAVASGKITPQEFIQLNHTIGGWKNEPDMIQEGSPFYPPGVINLADWDPWSHRNQVFSSDPLTPAPRVEGDITAMRAAYTEGLVFMGDIDIPVIDWRHYLEDVLDMHNTHQSFASRQRIRDARGHSDNQVIWFTDISGPDDPRFDQTPEALDVIDEWMENILDNPDGGVVGNKPDRAVDRCFNADGSEMAAGDGVWNGILDEELLGACAEEFPLYSTSRIVAGGPFKGSIFKCELKSVQQAIDDGDYGVWIPDADQQAMLEKIFTDGVCDFSQPDIGLPPGW